MAEIKGIKPDELHLNNVHYCLSCPRKLCVYDDNSLAKGQYKQECPIPDSSNDNKYNGWLGISSWRKETLKRIKSILADETSLPISTLAKKLHVDPATIATWIKKDYLISRYENRVIKRTTKKTSSILCIVGVNTL